MKKKPFFLLIGINICFTFLVFFLFCKRVDTRFDYISTTHKTTSSTSSNPLAFESQLISLVKDSSQSVVSIFADKSVSYSLEDNQGNSLGTTQKEAKVGGGSGIICSKSGYIITNKHVVEDTTAHYTVSLYDGSIRNVDKIWFDDQLDLAFLRITDKQGKYPKNLPAATFTDLKTSIDVGQFVLAIGNSFAEYANTTTLGIISGKHRQLKLNDNNNLYAGLYQTDAAINPGNSGGPLVSTDGKVIGIVTAVSRGGTNIGFALPLNQSFIDATLDGLTSAKTIVRPLLGVDYKNTSSGNIVIQVFPDTPADTLLFSGDIITDINNQPISEDLPFLYQLYSYKPGDTLIFTIIRDHKKLQVPLLLGSKSK